MVSKRTVDILLSLMPVAVLVGLLFTVIRVFGSSSLDGGSQVALLTAAAVCCAIAVFRFKTPWRNIEEGIISGVGSVSTALLILLMIGAVSGMWILSGVVPTLIYYGLQIIHPSFFPVTTCVICGIVSLLTGSSWSTIATIGIALFGIGTAQGFSPGLVAGAIISGAYFGDKMSPLSDTTVLASTMSGTPLFTHIRYMMHTTVPSLIITLIIFTFIGLSHTSQGENLALAYSSGLASHFNLTPWLMLVPLGTAFLIAKRMPALVVLFLSTLLAAIFAIIFQPEILTAVAGTEKTSAYSMFVGVMRGMYDSTSIDMGSQELTDLVATRGMAGMLNTIYLILCSVSFGGCMQAAGMLRRLSVLLLRFTRRCVSLVGSTVFTGAFMNCIVADQYLSIILTANMFKGVYSKRGYENRLLSRSIEDSATILSPLIPWGSCGMTQATVLGVSTITYLPFCFFNLISPFMSVIVAALGYGIKHLKEKENKK